MSGDAVIIALLAAHADVLALIDLSDVPSRLTGDPLGQGVLFPAVRVESISQVPLGLVRAAGKRHVRERVQVTCFAATLPELRTLETAVRRACADMFPVHAGLTQVTVRAIGTGPDAWSNDPAVRLRSHDFMVTYNENR